MNPTLQVIIKSIMREDEIEPSNLAKDEEMFQHDPIRDKKRKFNQYHIYFLYH